MDLPNPGIEPRSRTLQADSLPAEPQGKPYCTAQGNSGQCHVATRVGGNVEGEGIHVHVWLNPFAVTESYHNVVNQLCCDTK